MEINANNLRMLEQGFSAAFRTGLARSAPVSMELAMTVPSSTAENVYDWLADNFMIREWIGDRHLQNIGKYDYTLKNRDFEGTIKVNRNKIQDDQYGSYGLMFQQMGDGVTQFPDKLNFGLLKAGFNTPCFDGQYFFDTDHPVGLPGKEVSVSNHLGGSGEAWFVMDTSKVLIAQAKVIYDKDFELLADATEREKKLVQERFDLGLLHLQSYLAEKARLQDVESQQAIARLQARLQVEKNTLADNERILKSAKAGNETSQAKEAVTANKSKVSEIEVDIGKKERDRLDAARALSLEGEKFTTELRDQQDAIETQIKQLKGVESIEDIQRRVQKQFAPELAKAFQRDGGVEGDAVKNVQKLIDLTVLKETLSRAEREYARMLENIRIQEDAVRLDEAAGAITVYEAERKIFDIRAAQLPLLQAQLAEVEKISGSLSPEDQARAAQAKNGLKQMGDLRTDAERQIRSSIGSGFSQFFVDIASGTKTVGDARD